MSLVIPSVTRFAYQGVWSNGRPIVNTIDVAWDTSGTFGDRADNIEDVAADVRNAWQDHIMGIVTNNYTFLAVTWVDIDSATGSTGSLPFDTGRPNVGASSDPSLPPSQCYQINKFTTHARGARAGRWFLAGVPEGDVDENGILADATADTVNSHLEDYLDSISDVGGLTIDKAPVVVHAASATGNRIHQMQVASLVCYQGRRIGR